MCNKNVPADDAPTSSAVNGTNGHVNGVTPNGTNGHVNGVTPLKFTASIVSSIRLVSSAVGRPTVLLLVVLWYLVSFFGILSNKHLVSSGSASRVEPSQLAMVQTLSTVVFGGLSQLWPFGVRTRPEAQCAFTWRMLGSLAILGILRILTLLLGLVSLKYVAASFTETIKASSPFFTVLAAFFILGERTRGRLLLALIPVVGGLMVAAGGELSFNLIGFSAALATNCVECIQNVFCKTLLKKDEMDKEGYTPVQLQYYSAVAALLVQLPVIAYSYLAAATPPAETAVVAGMDSRTMCLLGLAGFNYYLQSALVYAVMAHFSPVTVSVLNTVKRALIICLSVVVFQNHLSRPTQIGTCVCLCGGGLYNLLSYKLRQKAKMG